MKPTILGSFGDIALAIGDKFEPYLFGVMDVLNQAAALCNSDRVGSPHIKETKSINSKLFCIQLDPEDYEETEYVAALRDAIIEAYVGIVQGLKTAEKSEWFLHFWHSSCLGLCNSISCAASALVPFLDMIFGFADLVATDPHQIERDGTKKALLGLIG